MLRSILRFALVFNLTLQVWSLHRLDIKRYSSLGEAERFDFNRAEELLKKRRWAAAKNELSKFLKLYPRSVACSYAQLMIGYCEEQLKNKHTAIKEYKAVRDYYPDSPEAPLALSWIARVYDAIDQPEDSMKYWNMCVKEYPDHPLSINAYWRLAQFYLSRKMESTAIEFLEKIITKYRPYAPHEDYGTWYRAGEWLTRYYAINKDDPDLAISTYVRFRSKYLREHDRWKEDSAKQRAKKEALNFVASAYRGAANQARRAKDTIKAKKYYKRAMDLYEEAGNKVEQAWFNKEFGLHQKAVDILLLYLAEHERDDNTRWRFGRYLEEIGKWEDARAQFAKMFDKNRGLAEIAESYWRQGKNQDAIDAFKRVAENDLGRYAWALYRIGDVHLHRLNDPKIALRYYKDSFYGQTRYLFAIAECYRRMKEYEKAITQLREIVTVFRNQAPEAYRRITYIYHERRAERDMERCIAVCRRICRQFPKSGHCSWAHQHLEEAHKTTITGGGVKTETEVELLGF